MADPRTPRGSGPAPRHGRSQARRGAETSCAGSSRGRHAAPRPQTGARASSARRDGGRVPASRVSVGATTRRVSERTQAKTRSRGSVPQGPRLPQGASRLPLVIAGAVAVAAIAIACFVVSSCASQPAPDAPQAPASASGDIEIQVPEGAGTDAIAQSLVDAGLVKDGATFTRAVMARDAGQSLKPGTYRFAAGTSVDDIVAQLAKGPNTTSNRVTVPEGLTVAKTAACVADALGIPADEFLSQAKASNYASDYPFLSQAADDSLEGFLWASTYDFSGKQVSADAVIRAMLDRYGTATASVDWQAGEAALKSAYGVDFNDYNVLILASVIEREAVTEQDRPLVSSVFYNRMRDGMPLQSDATMGYVTGGEVSADDLKQESPYNTYLNRGLPPTPICTPSIECINAALHPQATDYLYFLIIENGSYSNHTFSRTYDEHMAAIDQAKRDQS
ncbi:endolytic transglycosylase MltG [Atopobiaceae bacterium 24-176]